jgi:cytochrome subunit of sulfide dehydrogenase
LSDRTEAAARGAAAFFSAVLVCLSMVPARAADAPPGAASCSGCHPTHASVDTPVRPLVGFYGSAIVQTMKVFRSGQRPATVMDRIAKGFSDDEIEAIEAWFVMQPVVTDSGSPLRRAPE